MVIKTLYSQMYNEVKNHIGTFPFELNLDDDYLREDVYKNEINFNDMVINVKDYDDNRVKVPKVVE